MNSAKDDAAGLAIAERMTAQIRGFDVAARNANDGVSLLQVADGALGKIGDNMQRMRELAVQAKNGTLNTTDRSNLNREYQELASEIGRIRDGTSFNGNAVFSAANKSVNIQIGAANATTDTLQLNLTDTGANGGNDLTTILANASNAFGDISSTANAANAITAIDANINVVTNLRATAGAGLSRLEQVASSLQNSSANLASARGRIVDADFAKETASLTRAQILQQAGTAMLAQANQLPNNVLSLLR